METALPLVDELSAIYARVSGLLLTQETVQTSLALVARLVHETVPDSVGAGITLVDQSGKQRSTGSTDERVTRFDQLQYDLNEGPCLTSHAARILVRVEDTSADQNFPRWSSTARGMGVGAILSAPLVSGDRCLGSMKVYAEVPGAFDERAQRLLPLFASQAAILLANAQAYEKAHRVSEQMHDALLSRDAISTARGILMAQDGLTEQEAMRMLISVASRQKKRLRDVADSLIATVQRRNR